MPELSTAVNVPNPISGGDYNEPGGSVLKTLSAPFRYLANKIKSWTTPERRVVEAGDGTYRLKRKGRAALRLNVVARNARPERSASTLSSRLPGASTPTTAPTISPSGTVAQTGTAHTTSSSTPASSATPASKLAAFQEDWSGTPEQGARAEINQAADELRRARQSLAAADPTGKRAAHLDTQVRLKEVALEQAVTKHLDLLKAVDAASQTLPKDSRAAVREAMHTAERFLLPALIEVHLPGPAAMLRTAIGAKSPQELGAALEAQTGKTPNELRQRFGEPVATGLVGAGDLGEIPFTWGLLDGHMADQFVADLGRLMKADLLEPALLRRLADVGRMREWSKTASDDNQTENLRNLDAFATLAEMTKALSRGDETTVNFLLGGDSRLDDYALELKTEMARNPRPSDLRGGTAPPFDEETVRLRHALSQAKRGLQKLLKAKQHVGFERRNWLTGATTVEATDHIVIGKGGSDRIRIDSRLLNALRTAGTDDRRSVEANAEAGRDVNMLIANIMLLQQRLDAKEASSKVLDAQLKKDSCEQTLKTGMERAKIAGKDKQADPILDKNLWDWEFQQGMLSLNHAVKLKSELAGLEADESNDRSDKIKIARGKLDESLFQIGYRLPRAFEDNPDPEDLEKQLPELDERYGGIARACVAYDMATKELSRAEALIEADQALGLDDKDLLQMGFSLAEILNLKGDMDGAYVETIGGVAKQGLKSSKDVGEVNESINKIIGRLLGKGSAQENLNTIGKQHAESRANIFLDLAFQNVTDRPNDFTLRSDDDAVRDAFAAKTLAFVNHANYDPKQDYTGLAIDQQFAASAAEYSDLSGRLGRAAADLAAIDPDVEASRGRLAELAQKTGMEIDPSKPKGFAISKALHEAVRTDQTLQVFERIPATDQTGDDRRTIAELNAKLDVEMAKLRRLDPDTMQATLRGDGLRSREALRAFATEDNLEIARRIIDIRSAPERKMLAKQEIENIALQMDTILDARRQLMSPDAATPSHLHLRNAIRAAVLDARLASGDSVATFDPAGHRTQIEGRLRGWGIGPELFKPEIDEVLHGDFNADEVETWIKEARADLTSAQLSAAQNKSAWQRAGRWLGRTLRDNQAIDHATKTTVMETIGAMNVGDRLYVAQGDGGKLSSGKVPIEATGTLKVRAEIAAGAHKLFEVQRTDHGFELFFKAGLQGQGTLGVSADAFEVVDVGVSASGGGRRLAGAGLRFKCETDLRAFLDKLLDQSKVSPSDWSKSDEAVLVKDRMWKIEGEASASATTKSVGSKVGWVKENLALDEQFLGHLDVEAFAGVELKGGIGRESRTVTEQNANRRSVETEVTWDKTASATIGAYLMAPTLGDALADEYMERSGALNKIDEAIRRNQMLGKPGDEFGYKPIDAPDAHMWNPFGSKTYTPLSVSAQYKASITRSSKLSYAHDGLLSGHGNEITKVVTSHGKFAARDLAPLGQDLTKREVRAGASDGLLRLLIDNPEGIADSIKAMLKEAASGDKVAVAYGLRDDVRTVINQMLKDSENLLSAADDARLAGRNGDADAFTKQAELHRGRAAALYKAESSYVPDKITVIKTKGAVDTNRNVLSLGPISWTRFSQGGLEQPALTIKLPGGPSAQAEQEHAPATHGGSATQAASPSSGSATQQPQATGSGTSSTSPGHGSTGSLGATASAPRPNTGGAQADVPERPRGNTFLFELAMAWVRADPDGRVGLVLRQLGIPPSSDTAHGHEPNIEAIRRRLVTNSTQLFNLGHSLDQSSAIVAADDPRLERQMLRFEAHPESVAGALQTCGLSSRGGETAQLQRLRAHLRVHPEALAEAALDLNRDVARVAKLGLGDVPSLVPRDDPDLDRVRTWLQANPDQIGPAIRILELDDTAAKAGQLDRGLEQITAELRLYGNKIGALAEDIGWGKGQLPQRLVPADHPDLERMRLWLDGHPKEIVGILKTLGLKHDDCTSENYSVGRGRIQAHLRLNPQDIPTALAPLDQRQRQTVAFDKSVLQTAEPIANGRDFYLEPQQNAQCAQHAINAFLGGPAVRLEQLNAFKTSAYGDEDQSEGSQRVVYDSRSGSAITEPTNYLSLLHRLNLSPYPVKTEVIDATGRLSNASPQPPQDQDIPGDRCIVYSQSSHGSSDPNSASWTPQAAHFVAFRKDSNGEWWLLDSLEKAKGPIQMSPGQYMTGSLGRFPRQTMSIAMLDQPAAQPQPLDPAPPPPQSALAQDENSALGGTPSPSQPTQELGPTPPSPKPDGVQTGPTEPPTAVPGVRRARSVSDGVMPEDARKPRQRSNSDGAVPEKPLSVEELMAQYGSHTID